MSKYLRQHSKKAGLPPGSLVTLGNGKEAKETVSLIDFTETQVTEKHNISPAECKDHIAASTITWIQVTGVSDPKIIETLGSEFKLHPLILEDIISCGQRSKIDSYKEHLFIVMQLLSYGESNKLQEVQVSIVLAKNLVISFAEKQDDIFHAIKERIHKSNSRIRKMGADYLVYAILDVIVDNYFVILEKIDDQLEQLEEELIREPGPQALLKIQQAKRNITLLRKSVWPTREVINQFQHIESPLVTQSIRIYLKDVYDHAIQAIDTIEGFRDIASGMLEIYISHINLRMNEVMKMLTVVATLFVPLTFIASIYGMNFDYMPELHHEWGYPIVLCVMLVIALFMLLHFRRKKWI
jgi:magnesium transporter